MGSDIPHRHDQVADADRRLLAFDWAEIQVNARLCAHGVAHGGLLCVHARTWPHPHSVRRLAAVVLLEKCVLTLARQVTVRERRDVPGLRASEPAAKQLGIESTIDKPILVISSPIDDHRRTLPEGVICAGPQSSLQPVLANFVFVCVLLCYIVLFSSANGVPCTDWPQ